jgi:hypothetical protein
MPDTSKLSSLSVEVKIMDMPELKAWMDEMKKEIAALRAEIERRQATDISQVAAQMSEAILCRANHDKD